MKIVSIWYRALGPYKRLLCESKSKREVLKMTEDEEVVRYERMVTYEINEGWRKWNPEEEEEEDATAS